MTKTCAGCGQLFSPMRADALYCSDRCGKRVRRGQTPQQSTRVPGPVHAAVVADVERLGAAGTVDAAVAELLALVIDDPGTSASGLVACCRELRAVLARMDAAGAATRPSIFDDLLARRATRRASLTPTPGA